MSTTNEDAPRILPQWCGPDEKGRSRALWSTGELAASHIDGRIYISVHSGRYGVFPRKQYVDEDKAFRAFAHAGHPLPPLPEKAEAPAPYVLADDPFFQEPIETKWGPATWRKVADRMLLSVDGCSEPASHIACVHRVGPSGAPRGATVYAGLRGLGQIRRLRGDNVLDQIVPTLRHLGSLPDEAPPAPEPTPPEPDLVDLPEWEKQGGEWFTREGFREWDFAWLLEDGVVWLRDGADVRDHSLPGTRYPSIEVANAALREYGVRLPPLPAGFGAEAPPAPEPETPARAPAPTASPDPTPEDKVLALAADLEVMARDWWWDGFETDAAVLRGAVEAVRRHVHRTSGEA